MNGSEASSAQSPLRVLSLESRRADEMQSLIERHGGIPTIAPSMREVPLDENVEAFAFGEELLAGRIDLVVFLTGVGATALLETLCTRWPRDVLLTALSQCVVVVRGPKPTAVLRGWNLRIDYRAPEPNTWRELLKTLIDSVPLGGRRIAIQEYGKPNPLLYEGLRAQGAGVFAVPIYRWEMPEDTAPLGRAVEGVMAGRFDLILFTSAQQFHHAFQIAEESQAGPQWLEAAGRCVIASIGPTATETLQEGGLRVDLQPTHPKMGPLVREAIEAAPAILAAKRARL
jgi:uroporphyrinogen-III synthase